MRGAPLRPVLAVLVLLAVLAATLLYAGSGCVGSPNIHSWGSLCLGRHTFGPQQVRVAVVKPVFTTSAYNSFYTFYMKYAGVPPNQSVTSDLYLLNTSVVDGWGYSLPLYQFVVSKAARDVGLALGNNTFVLTDVDLDQGRLFEEGAAQYSVVIVGFEEYVSEKEYAALREFVAGGGTLIVLCGGSFLAEVRYSPTTNTIALVKGHGWSFDGKVAVKSVYNRWYAENNEWVGSNYAYYAGSQQYSLEGAVANTSNPYSVLLRTVFGQNLFDGEGGREVNVMTNSSDSVIAYWVLSGLKEEKGRVAVYGLHFGKGVVYHMGVFGVDLLSNRQFQFLLLSLIGLHRVDVQAHRSGCTLELVAHVVGAAPPNESWRGWVYDGKTAHPMIQLNATTLAYSFGGCAADPADLTVLAATADGLVGAYAKLSGGP